MSIKRWDIQDLLREQRRSLRLAMACVGVKSAVYGHINEADRLADLIERRVEGVTSGVRKP